MKIGEETSDREYEKRAVKEREIEREKRVHTRSGKARKTARGESTYKRTERMRRETREKFFVRNNFAT